MKKSDIVSQIMQWCNEQNLVQRHRVSLDLNEFRELLNECVSKSRIDYVRDYRLKSSQRKIEKLKTEIKDYKQDRASLKIISRNLGW